METLSFRRFTLVETDVLQAYTSGNLALTSYTSGNILHHKLTPVESLCRKITLMETLLRPESTRVENLSVR